MSSISWVRRWARSSSLAVMKTFTGASGKTTVPISRPSITPEPLPRPLALAPDELLADLGVDGHDAHGPGHFGAADLDSCVHPVDEDPLAHLELMSAASLATTGASSGSTPRRMAMKATARYIAPVSR